MSPFRLVLAWAVGIVAVECLVVPGAATWADAVAVPIVLLLVGLTKWSVGRSTVEVPPRLRAWGRRLAGTFRVEYGVDFRGEPPVPRRTPTAQVAIALLTIGAGVGALLVPTEAFRGIRDALVPGASTAYVAGLTLAWGWAAAISTVGLFTIWYAVSDTVLASGPPSPRTNRIRVALPFVALAVSVLATTTLPLIAPAVALTIVLAVSVAPLSLRSMNAIELLWRTRGHDDVFGVGSRWFYGWRTFTYVCVPLVTVVIMTRGAWAGGRPSSTAWIGGTAGWLSVLGSIGWLWIGPVRVLRLATRHGSGEHPTALRFVGGAPSPDVVGSLVARGFRVVEHASDVAVEVALDHLAPDPRDEVADRGVRRLASHELLSARALSELRTADRRARREEVLEALRRIMRIATTMTFDRGSGFWFAPHLWYIWGMSRDTDEVDMITVGPPYHRVISPEARSHCLEVFRAIAIDLVFIQDGVIAASAERALTQLFDHFDVWGVSPIEERHFRHMPGIRILIQDFEQGRRLGREGYREPDYEQIGRARILLVMIERDGGGEDSPDLGSPTREPIGLVLPR